MHDCLPAWRCFLGKEETNGNQSLALGLTIKAGELVIRYLHSFAEISKLCKMYVVWDFRKANSQKGDLEKKILYPLGLYFCGFQEFGFLDRIRIPIELCICIQ